MFLSTFYFRPLWIFKTKWGTRCTLGQKLEFDAWNNVIFEKSEILKMWFLRKVGLWIVIFVKNEILKMIFLWRMRFRKCDFWKKISFSFRVDYWPNHCMHLMSWLYFTLVCISSDWNYRSSLNTHFKNTLFRFGLSRQRATKNLKDDTLWSLKIAQ